MPASTEAARKTAISFRGQCVLNTAAMACAFVSRRFPSGMLSIRDIGMREGS